MKKVTCVGYHDSGSGAVDNYLREFSGLKMCSANYECRILQDPDGISDLEYNLIENPHRLNSGYAIKRFRKHAKSMNRFYSHIFGDEWMAMVDEYINGLTSICYKGWWHMDIQLLPLPLRLYYKFRRGFNKLLPKPIRKSSWYNYFPNLCTYHSYVSEEQFLRETRLFMEKLCKKIQSDDSEYCVLDQLVNPPNLRRYMRYVNDLKVIVIDRDPRDIFIEETKKYKHAFLPKDVNEFIKVYRDSRKIIACPEDESSVLHVKFEDLIYRYDDTTKKINEFLGITEEQHIHKFERFDPKVSIKNTQLWKVFTQYDDELKIIESELPEFLYQYD